MMDTYENIISYIDELIEFLNAQNIKPKIRSHLENDYLLAQEFYENYKNDPSSVQDNNARAAFVGLYELYKWIWSVKNCTEFDKIKNHLGLLVEASPRINSYIRMISPVTQKQDDKTNKFIETIVGMYAIKIGNNIEMDDPDKSSGGKNPDVLFTYKNKRIAFACKTLRSSNISTILNNLKSAAEQIEKSNCDIGYIIINAMNILDHNKIKDKVYTDHNVPIDLLCKQVLSVYNHLEIIAKQKLLDLFFKKKARPVILTFVHSVTRISSSFGSFSTSLKVIIPTEFHIPKKDTYNDSEIFNGVNDFLHNRLMNTQQGNAPDRLPGG